MNDEELKEAADREQLRIELEDLCRCYQIACRDDKNVVWAALNKYMPHVARLQSRA